MMNLPLEVVYFGNEDVVATSGVPKLSISNWKNATPDDLTVSFGGKSYTGSSSYNDLHAALDANNLGVDTSFTGRLGSFNMSVNWSLEGLYDSDSASDTAQNVGNIMDGCNGGYTWFADQNKWIHD